MSTLATDVLPTTGRWAIDSRHSTARFSLRHHAVASFRGSFYPLAGSFDAERRELYGELEVADLHVPIDALREHMLTDAFFDAENHPKLTFASTAISASGGDLTVEGDLTIRGVTKRVLASGSAIGPVEVPNRTGEGSTERFGIDLEVTIDRRDFGVNFNYELSPGVINLGWKVLIDVALELIRSPD